MNAVNALIIRPYGLLSERVDEAMYPEGHPYSWSTIGYLEDLDRAQIDDLKRFLFKMVWTKQCDLNNWGGYQ